jgi:hypothetical protein
MQDVNVSNDLRQISFGQVKALEYSRYDINEYRFQTAKLEASHPLVATTNSGVVARGEDASGVTADYYGILQKLLSMVEVKHKSRYSGNNLLFAHQAH